MRTCLGLSVGAARLVAAPAGQPPTVRHTVLTLFGHRPPEVGLPPKNPGRSEPGLVLTDFTDRVGDPVPIIAADGSSHRGERLLAAAIDAMTRAATGHRPGAVGVAVPAYWSAHAVDAARRALPEATVITDDVAALTALQARPGLPARGVIAACDFGAGGTSITLVDAGDGFRRIGTTVRYPDFSGDLIDQALLRQVLGGLDVDPVRTSAVPALALLRMQCRSAKERLSEVTATGVPVAGSTVRVTRTELEALLATPVDGFLTALRDTLHRNHIAPADLSAVATVGGGARIPYVTERISQELRLPVTTSAHAGVVAAIGAGLIAGRSREQVPATELVAPVAAEPVTALAWSAVEPITERVYDEAAARPGVQFLADATPAPEEVPALPWYRRPGVVFGAAASIAAAAAVTLVLTSGADGASSAADAGTAIPVTPLPVEATVSSVPPPAAPTPATVVAAPPRIAAPAAAGPVERPRPPSAVRVPAAGAVPAAPPPAPAPAPAPAPVPPPVAAPPPPAMLPLPIVIPLPVTPPVTSAPPPTSTPPPTEPTPTTEPTPSPEPEPEPEPSPEPEPPPTTEPTPSPQPEPEPAPEPDTGDAECVPTAETAC